MHVGIVSLHTNLDHVLDLANALHETGTAVTLYLSRSNVLRAVPGSDDPAQTLYERNLLAPAVKVRLFQLGRMRDPRSFLAVRGMAQAIRGDGVDVVHIVMGGGELWTAALANLLRDVPSVAYMEIPQPNVGEYPPAFVVRAVNKLLTLGTDVIIVSGRDHIAMLHKLYHVPEDRLCYVTLGPFTAFTRWATHTVPEDPGTVLFFGRANRHKGLEYLVRAQPLITRRVPQTRIIIAAHGKELERCRAMIQDASRFEIHDGFIPGDVVAALYQRVSLVVLPYLTATTSGVLMTAYVFGKPVVATRVGSLPEYVREGVTGLLVPPADVEQLADAIVRLLSDDEGRHRMGENAAQWVEGELSWQNVAAQTLQAYDRAISVHQGRR